LHLALVRGEPHRGTLSCGVGSSCDGAATVPRGWICGDLFGMNLAVFVRGDRTTASRTCHDRVSPCAVLIVPVGGLLFREYIDPACASCRRACVWRPSPCPLMRRPAATPRCSERSRRGRDAVLVSYVGRPGTPKREWDVTTVHATIFCTIAALAVSGRPSSRRMIS